MSDSNPTLTDGDHPGEGGQDLAGPAVARDEHGRLLPGARLNPAGRPNGRPNDTTIEANLLLRAGARKAAQTLISALDSPNEYLKVQTAVKVLERSGVGPNGDGEPPEYAYTEEATERELAVVLRLFERWKDRHFRMSGGVSAEHIEARFAPIDVTPTTLPAGQQQPEPPDDDVEEFDAS